MANRYTLHVSHLPKLQEWLQAKGFELLPLSNNPYEVLRARKDKRTIVVYKKLNAKEHLSIMDRDYPLIRAFLNEVKQNEQT